MPSRKSQTDDLILTPGSDPSALPTPKPRAKRKPELSPTRIRSFLTCPMLYRLEYIDKVGRFYHRAQAGWALGSTLHQTLQAFHEEGGADNVSRAELIEKMDAGWISSGYGTVENETRHRNAAAVILHGYHSSAAERAETTRTFLTEKMLKYDMGAFVLTGRIDRIDEHLADGALEIVDYKTWDSVHEDDVKEAMAMSVYQLLVKRLHPDRRVFATIHALAGGVTASASFTDEEMAAFEDDLRGVGLMILETDWEAVFPKPIADTCPGCDFLKICRSYWIREGAEWERVLGIP